MKRSKMDWKKALTPKDTEEVKPGLYIQRWKGSYRQVHPAVWKGEVNWKNLLLGSDAFKALVFFIIIIFLAYGYHSSTKACEDFQSDPCKYLPQIQKFCVDIYPDSVVKDGEEKGWEFDPTSLQNYP
jgi:hypothetical protein